MKIDDIKLFAKNVKYFEGLILKIKKKTLRIERRDLV